MCKNNDRNSFRGGPDFFKTQIEYNIFTISVSINSSITLRPANLEASLLADYDDALGANYH